MQSSQDVENLADCLRIYEQWHAFARDGDTEALCRLYADDAVIETPLALAIPPNHTTGLLRGKSEIRQFLEEGRKRRPNELVRWYRSGTFFANGRQVVWEYPRATPDGDQVDLVEAIDVAGGLIAHHRIYWGWFGVRLLIESAVAKVRAELAGELRGARSS